MRAEEGTIGSCCKNYLKNR